MPDIDYKKELKAGICEVVYMDSMSVEHIALLTLSTNHVTAEEPKCDIVDNRMAIVAWNMNEEEWQKIPIHQIVNFERLTGFGVKDNSERFVLDEEGFSAIMGDS